MCTHLTTLAESEGTCTQGWWSVQIRLYGSGTDIGTLDLRCADQPGDSIADLARTIYSRARLCAAKLLAIIERSRSPH